VEKEERMVYLRYILLTCLVVGIGYAQPNPAPNVIYQHLITAGTSTGVNTNITNNIGQAQHTLTAIFKNNGANTCSTPNPILALQASYDNVTYFTISLGPTRLNPSYNNALIYTLGSAGNYPYLRSSVILFDNTNCTIDLYYSGSVVSQNVLANGSQISAGVGNAAFTYPIGSQYNIHINTNTTTTFPTACGTAGPAVGLGCGILRGIVINTKGATGNTATIYSNKACTAPLATIDTTSTLGYFPYEALSSGGTGFCIVTATGTPADITVLYSGVFN
jgi:hypothetical protein